MINVTTGALKIDDALTIVPGYSFADFKKTRFYKGQDGIRIIPLEEKQELAGCSFFVNLFFREGEIYSVSLIYSDERIGEAEEPKRKMIHDKILLKNGLEHGKEYAWGKAVSNYDRRSNISSIDIYYKV
jgi:hypothetical protein